MDAPASIPAFIATWKKLTDFCADVGCGYEAGRKMRDRGSIAPEHWANVIAAAEAKGIAGVTYEWLAKQRAEALAAAPATGEAA